MTRVGGVERHAHDDPPTPTPTPMQGFKGALVDVTALSRFGLARCPTARCAVSLMGELAQAVGYYSAGAAKDEGGEQPSSLVHL